MNQPFNGKQELAAQDVFKKVVLVGRRQVELPKGPGYDKMVRGSIDWSCQSIDRSISPVV